MIAVAKHGYPKRVLEMRDIIGIRFELRERGEDCMCFSAVANFTGSGVLGTIGVVTLTRVKHRRELLLQPSRRSLLFISSPKDSSGWDWMGFYHPR